MVQATMRIVTTDKRSGGILWDSAWCDACVAQHRAAFAGDRSIKIQTWRYDGEPRPCASCDDSENAPEFKFSTVTP